MNESGHAGGNVRPVAAELLFLLVVILFSFMILTRGTATSGLTGEL
jgi:hypothetical protein